MFTRQTSFSDLCRCVWYHTNMFTRNSCRGERLSAKKHDVGTLVWYHTTGESFLTRATAEPCHIGRPKLRKGKTLFTVSTNLSPTTRRPKNAYPEMTMWPKVSAGRCELKVEEHKQIESGGSHKARYNGYHNEICVRIQLFYCGGRGPWWARKVQHFSYRLGAQGSQVLFATVFGCHTPVHARTVTPSLPCAHTRMARYSRSCRKVTTVNQRPTSVVVSQTLVTLHQDHDNTQ